MPILKKFEEGRRNSGYLKLKLFLFSRLDCWILKYPENSNIPPHVDNVPEKYSNKTAVRINIILKSPKKGGIFKCDKYILNTKRVKIFNPTLTHSVSTIESGERYVLSIGFII